MHESVHGTNRAAATSRGETAGYVPQPYDLCGIHLRMAAVIDKTRTVLTAALPHSYAEWVWRAVTNCSRRPPCGRTPLQLLTEKFTIARAAFGNFSFSRSRAVIWPEPITWTANSCKLGLWPISKSVRTSAGVSLSNSRILSKFPL